MISGGAAPRGNGRLTAGIFAAALVILSAFIGYQVYDFQNSSALQAGRPAGPRLFIAGNGSAPLAADLLEMTEAAFRSGGGAIVATRPEAEDRGTRIWVEDYRVRIDALPAYGGRRVVLDLIHLDSGEHLARAETFLPDAGEPEEDLPAFTARTAREWAGRNGIVPADHAGRTRGRR